MPSFGQRLVTGRLVDKETGGPIKEATIQLIGTNITTTVNALGFFQLQIDSVDHITISSPKYEVIKVKIPSVGNFKVELVKSKSQSQYVGEKFYFDDYEFPCDQAGAKSYKIITQHPDEPSKFLVSDFDMNEVKKQTGTYSEDLYTRDGFFTVFHTNGQKSAEGYYKDNSQIGKWKKWYKNGQLKEESFYYASKSPDEVLRVENFWDSLGIKLVTDGNGEYFIDRDDQLKYAKGSIQNGFKTGKWIGYLKSGEVGYVEEYKKNKLISGISYDSLRKEYTYDKIMDYDLASMKLFYQFLNKNMVYPRVARENMIQGKVIIQMTIDSEGYILNSRIAKGLDARCDAEALRIIKKYDGKLNWLKKRGQMFTTFKSEPLYLPIVFKLNH